MGIIAIACYKAKEGRETQLREIVRRHVAILRTQGLVTDRKPTIMRSKDGTILELFEWRSQEAIDAAHRNATVKELWDRFGEACDFVKLSALAEAGDLFANFAPFDP